MTDLATGIETEPQAGQSSTVTALPVSVGRRSKLQWLKANHPEVLERLYMLIKAGAKPSQCGWIKDPFGLSWQIVPRRFIELIRDKDSRKVKAVMEAMMTMVKLDVAELERAYNEA